MKDRDYDMAKEIYSLCTFLALSALYIASLMLFPDYFDQFYAYLQETQGNLIATIIVLVPNFLQVIWIIWTVRRDRKTMKDLKNRLRDLKNSYRENND